MNRKKIGFILFGVFAILAVLIVGFEPQVRTYFTRSRVAPYRFKVVGEADLAQAITLQEEKVRKGGNSALEMTGLASLYLARARRFGDSTDYEKAESLAKGSLASLPLSNTGAKLVLAAVREARHDFQGAIELAEQALEEGGRDGAYSILVTSFLARGHLREAARYADRLATEKPGLSSLTLRALVLTACGRNEEAEFDFKRALLLEDAGEVQESARTRALLARFYLRFGRIGEAQDLLSESLRLIPGYPLALYLRGEGEAQRGDQEAAAKSFMDAFRVSRQLTYYRRYAETKGRLSTREVASEALSEVEKLMRAELEKGGASHALELAQLLLDHETPQAAKEALGLVETELLVRQDAETYRILARTLLQLSQLPQAREAIQNALRSGVTEPSYYRLASEIEAKLGNQPRAELYLRMAKKINPRGG